MKIPGFKRDLHFFGGFKLTFQHMARRRVTTQYPDEKKPKQPRQHGRHVLNRYEDGMEKCIGCELCAGVCPADCIYVRGLDNPPDHPVSPGERYGYVYEINYLRCIHCDLCVEACPTEAITETKLFEFSFTNRSDAIYTKKELVVRDDGLPQQLPWEDWRVGDDQHTSGWMRATSPAGRAEFEGQVQWGGELGYGTRPPEMGQSGPPDPELTGTMPLREVLEAHLLEDDVAIDRAGIKGRMARMQEKGEGLKARREAAKLGLPRARDGAAEALPLSMAPSKGEMPSEDEVPSDDEVPPEDAAVMTDFPVTATTIPDLATFVVSAAIILAGAIGVVTSRNPVHAALNLVMTLFGVAVLFIEQQADFLAAVQVIVYAGAIVVLFLFVIMFLGVDKSENLEQEPLRFQRPMAFLLVAVAVAGILVLAGHSHWATGAHAVAGSTSGKASDTAKLGRSIFTTYLFAFEATSALLVIAVVGAVILARRPPRPEPGEEDEPRALTEPEPEADAQPEVEAPVVVDPQAESQPQPEPQPPSQPQPEPRPQTEEVST